jgi:hypothetical protein
MTSTVFLNLIVSIVAIAGVAALMRAAYMAADGPAAEQEAAPQPVVELERAA